MSNLAVTVRFDRLPTRDPRVRPQCSARSARTVLYFDGRLDNRHELHRELAVPSSCADGELALHAVEKWGAAAPSRLLGDFAFLAWDVRDRSVLLARDHLGIRPLYFHAFDAGVRCAGSLAELLADPAIRRRVDEDSVARFLAGVPENGPRTLYADVARVPPGHVALVTPGHVRFSAYWTAASARPVRHRSDADYEAHCRELLTESVRCRLSGDEQAAVTLSGGLDSSAVTACGHLLVRDRIPPAPFSLVFPDHPAADERSFIEAVEKRIGRPATKVMPARADVATLARFAASTLDLPPTPSDVMAVPLWRSMAAHGHGVALTGVGGDYVFSGSDFHYADLLRSRRWLAALHAWRAARAEAEGAHSSVALLTKGMWPALPTGLKYMLRPAARVLGGRLSDRTPRPWLRLAVRTASLPDDPRGGSFAVEDIVRGLTSGMHSYFVEAAGRVAAGCGVELRHPLLDVRLVEFMLAIPEEQRRRHTLDKWLLRRALNDCLPAAVRDRRTKGDFSHVARQVFEATGERFYGDLQMARCGWVDGPAISRFFSQTSQRFADGIDAYAGAIPALWSVTAVELWLRALQEADDQHAIIGPRARSEHDRPEEQLDSAAGQTPLFNPSAH